MQQTRTTAERLAEMKKQCSAVARQLQDTQDRLALAERDRDRDRDRDKAEQEVRNLSSELTAVRFRLDATEAHLRSLGFTKENA